MSYAYISKERNNEVTSGMANAAFASTPSFNSRKDISSTKVDQGTIDMANRFGFSGDLYNNNK